MMSNLELNLLLFRGMTPVQHSERLVGDGGSVVRSIGRTSGGGLLAVFSIGVACTISGSAQGFNETGTFFRQKPKAKREVWLRMTVFLKQGNQVKYKMLVFGQDLQCNISRKICTYLSTPFLSRARVTTLAALHAA